MNTSEDLLENARAGNRRSLSKLLTLVEEGHNSPVEPGIGSSLGITGPPGVGKSSLIGKMIDVWVERGESVAVLALILLHREAEGLFLGIE